MRVSLLASSIVCCWLVHQPARAEACDDDDDRATEIEADTDVSKTLSDDAKAKLDRVADSLDHSQLAFEAPDLQIQDLNIDDEIAAVIDVAVIGARGDGKTQFLVHAIRALHGRAPALAGTEQDLNRTMMRLVLDPRAPRPDATPPGVVPHFTFRVRAAALFARLGWSGAFRLACKLARITGLVVLACALVVAGLVIALRGAVAPGVVVGATGAVLAAIAALIARGRIERAGEIEIVFWDVAGEQIYSPSAADYHALLGE